MPSRPTFYAVLAVAALIGMFTITARGNQTMFPAITDSQSSVSKILGLMDRVPGDEKVGSAVEQFIESGTAGAKDLASAKVLEAKGALVEALKKEVTKLTEAQIKQLTTQLCKDWGVISSSSSATSSAN